MNAIEYRISPTVANEELNVLFAPSWPNHTWCDFETRLARSLLYVCAYADGQLVGFVNVAWDGGIHAFMLDTTVHPSQRRRGVGRQLVIRASDEARARGIEWLHVDFEPHLRQFYASCCFVPTEAGLMRLNQDKVPGYSCQFSG